MSRLTLGILKVPVVVKFLNTETSSVVQFFFYEQDSTHILPHYKVQHPFSPSDWYTSATT